MLRSWALGLLVLALGIGCQQASVHSGDPGGEQLNKGVPPTSFQKNVDFDLSNYSTISAARITITNGGAASLLIPSVVNSGNAGVDPLSFAQSTQMAKQVDDELAMTGWRLIVNHSFGYCYAGAPGDANDFALDPERLLIGFGFGCCDQLSRILIWFWQTAGYSTRIAQMTFHTVPEIFYQGAWHMYDPDHQVYYLARDNKTVASVAQVIADPYLVARTADQNGNDPVGYSAQWMADQYAAARPSYASITYPSTPSYNLEPQQSFSLDSYNQAGQIFHGGSGSPLDSGEATSAQFDWNLDFSNPNWQQLQRSQSGISTVSSNGIVYLTNSSASPGDATYMFTSPFPVFNLQVSGTVDLAESGATVNAYVSVDGTEWSQPFALNGRVGSPTHASADLSAADQGQYGYFVKLELSGTKTNGARIGQLHITSAVQASRFLFPTLSPGKVNHMIYHDWSGSADHSKLGVSIAVQ
jgi:hypothetical protein